MIGTGSHKDLGHAAPVTAASRGTEALGYEFLLFTTCSACCTHLNFIWTSRLLSCGLFHERGAFGSRLWGRRVTESVKSINIAAS